MADRTLQDLVGYPMAPETINIGGHNILVDRKLESPENFFPNQQAIGNLGQLAMSIAQGFQDRRKKQDFIKSVTDIMGSNATADDKVQSLMQLKVQNQGNDFGLGIDDIVKQYQTMRGTPIYRQDTAGNIIPIGSVEKGSKVIPATKSRILTAPMIDTISKNENAYSTLGGSVTDLNANRDRYAQFMGPGKEVLRNPMRSYVNKDLQDFLGWKANVQDAFQQYRVAVTGAQASDKEIALLAKNRPTENDTFEVFNKKTQAVRKIGNRVISRYINNLGKAGYDITGYQDVLDNLDTELQMLGNEQVVEPQASKNNIKQTKTGLKFQIIP